MSFNPNIREQLETAKSWGTDLVNKVESQATSAKQGLGEKVEAWGHDIRSISSEMLPKKSELVGLIKNAFLFAAGKTHQCTKSILELAEKHAPDLDDVKTFTLQKGLSLSSSLAHLNPFKRTDKSTTVETSQSEPSIQSLSPNGHVAPKKPLPPRPLSENEKKVKDYSALIDIMDTPAQRNSFKLVKIGGQPIAFAEKRATLILNRSGHSDETVAAFREMMNAASSALGKKDDPASAFTLLDKMQNSQWGKNILSHNPEIREEFETLRENMQTIRNYNQEAKKLLSSLTPTEIKIHYKHSADKPEEYAKHCPQLTKVNTYIQNLQLQVKNEISQASTVEDKIKLTNKYLKLTEDLVKNRNLLVAGALANGLHQARGFNDDLTAAMPNLPLIVRDLKVLIRQEQFKSIDQSIPDPAIILASTTQIAATIETAKDRYTVAQNKLNALQFRKENKLEEHITNLERQRNEISHQIEKLATEPDKKTELSKLYFALADKKSEILHAQEVKNMFETDFAEAQWKQMGDPNLLKKLIEEQQVEIDLMEKALLK